MSTYQNLEEVAAQYDSNTQHSMDHAAAEGIETPDLEHERSAAALRDVAQTYADRLNGNYFIGFDVIVLPQDSTGHEHELIHRVDQYERDYTPGQIPDVSPGNPEDLFEFVDFTPIDDIQHAYDAVLADTYGLHEQQTEAVTLSEQDYELFARERFSTLTESTALSNAISGGERNVREAIAYYLGDADTGTNTDHSGLHGYGFTSQEIRGMNETLTRMDTTVDFDRRELIREFSQYTHTAELIHAADQYQPASFFNRQQLNGSLSLPDTSTNDTTDPHSSDPSSV